MAPWAQIQITISNYHCWVLASRCSLVYISATIASKEPSQAPTAVVVACRPWLRVQAVALPVTHTVHVYALHHYWWSDYFYAISFSVRLAHALPVGAHVDHSSNKELLQFVSTPCDEAPIDKQTTKPQKHRTRAFKQNRTCCLP